MKSQHTEPPVLLYALIETGQQIGVRDLLKVFCQSHRSPSDQQDQAPPLRRPDNLLLVIIELEAFCNNIDRLATLAKRNPIDISQN